jgi:hypothetical protein
MYQTDYDDFKKTLGDLCVAVNRPFNDDMARVFWEDLRGVHLSAVKERAKFLRACGKTRFTSSDLRPEREQERPANNFTPPPPTTVGQRVGNAALLRFLVSRGGVDERLVPRLVKTKNEIVAVAEPDCDTDVLRDVLLAAFGKVAA